jgi:hypothetical protein
MPDDIFNATVRLSVRFIAGTHNVTRQMTRSLARSGKPAARGPAEVRQPAGQAAAGRPRP